MLDQQLHALILKYNIYGVIGGIRKKVRVGSVCSYLLLAIGMLRLAWVLNQCLHKVSDTRIVFCGNSLKWNTIIWYLLFPSNRRKICFWSLDSWNTPTTVHGCPVLKLSDIQHKSINTILLLAVSPALYAKLIHLGFMGKVIDGYSIILDRHWEKYFAGKLKQEVYADISVSGWFRDHTTDTAEKQIWHKKLIAHFLRARDFLHAEDEIRAYISSGYADAATYQAFLSEVEALLEDIRRQMQERKQTDILIHWLDAMEKNVFFDMEWVGNTHNGSIFHRAYTVMDYTTTVMRSIFTGKNVKAGKLEKMGNLNENNILLLHSSRKRHIAVFSSVAKKIFDKPFVHDSCKETHTFSPAGQCLWYAMETILESKDPCVCFIHCMETHHPFNSGGYGFGRFYGDIRTLIPDNTSIDFTPIAKWSRDYLDQQLQWYHNFFPSSAVSIYMSDHGMETDLSEQNINMPFKIMGPGIMPGEESRLFSYKDMHKLINCFLDAKADISDCFTDFAIIDILDPYNESFSKRIRTEQWNHFCYSRHIRDKEELKKYIQTTKIVTDEGEYYTLNILGEESYYRDESCKINLASDPLYTKRIAELREKAGKFYNPWKEHRQVAIDFYTYLGITENDVLAQCF